MMGKTWIDHNFFWDFYPNFIWILLLFYLAGLVIINEKRWEFTFLYLMFFLTLLFIYRKPTPVRRFNFTHQVCNIDGTCRTIASSSYSSPKEILSPAFGYVADIKNDGERITIVIILTLMDIHAQYCPVGGKVVTKKHVTGKFNLAGILESSDQNEHSFVEINTTHGRVGIKQIAGMFTRRIQTVVEKNDTVGKGEYLGFIHLGSRVDLILPAKDIRLVIGKGQQVNGFNTVVAEWLF